MRTIIGMAVAAYLVDKFGMSLFPFIAFAAAVVICAIQDARELTK